MTQPLRSRNRWLIGALAGCDRHVPILDQDDSAGAHPQLLAVARTKRAALIADADDYCRAARQAMLAAREQIMLIGWDVDTRVALDTDKGESAAPVALGPLLSWIAKKRTKMRSPSRARTGMLAEHLGKGAAEVESCLRRIDSLIACIEELRGKRRSLVPFEPEEPSEAARQIGQGRVARLRSAERAVRSEGRRSGLLSRLRRRRR